MTILPPLPGEPRRPYGPRDPGDAWVVAPTGERYWGRFGAAGLLALDPARGVLLQHRVEWSDHGGTWGLPGGARHEGESAVDAARREAREEAGVPDGTITPRFLSVLDLDVWSYTTVVGDVVAPFEPVIADRESLELAWVPPAQVADHPLHPGFAAAWPRLRTLLDHRPVIVIDAANVVGATPDGWWRDRAGAARRLLGRVDDLALRGVPAGALGLSEDRWFPDYRVVVEGDARAVSDRDTVATGVVRAPGSGDDTIVAETERLRAAGRAVTVVTSDRGLTERVTTAGAATQRVHWLLDLLD
ncbi:NUDIX domain-containing protein [Raineyella sp. LH-20]|uniref:NUDIX domain-containing protein n=1 Tax=Raineyella sp. LH-20 TaxID=3081204 RepID=UPI002953BCDD|nr:NUDIX domain-containing protein [Raineyella sp. LH-20]WOP18263.1 NUDIX domain-containing protein [Raineyella sp. LH-20]